MSAATTQTHEAIIKRLYPEDRVEHMMYDNNPLFAMIPKKYDFLGGPMHRAIRIAQTAGRSASFPNAKANKTASAIVKLLITTVQDYSLYSVTGKLIRETASTRGALVEALEEEVQSAMDAMNRSFGYGVYGNFGGAIGQISATSNVATNTITLANIDDVVKFEKNQVLQVSLTDGTTGAPRVGNVTVTAIDRDLGTITVNVVWNVGVPTVAVGDFIFPDGDFGAKMSGLASWLPAVAPTLGDNFFGLDRSADPTRLAGTRVPATVAAGLLISEAVKKGLQVGFRNGAKTTHIFMNDKRFLDLELELGTQKRWVDTTLADVGFTGIEFVGHGGKPVEIYPDPNCPVNTIFGLQMDTWSIEGPGKFPFIAADDGTKMLREESADAYEGRIVSYHQMICKAPGRNWRVDLA